MRLLGRSRSGGTRRACAFRSIGRPDRFRFSPTDVAYLTAGIIAWWMFRMSTLDLSRLATLAAALLAQLPKGQGAWQPDPACARNLEIFIDTLTTGDAASVEFGALLRNVLARPRAMTTL
jgi:hypothetical protein